MRFSILTLFPKAFDSYLGESILKRAREKKLIKIDIIDIRKFTSDKHKTARPTERHQSFGRADDKPYGGGPGMVMKAEPILRAAEVALKIKSQKSKVIILSAAGKKFTSKMAKNLLLNTDHLILVAGHYEGIDERVAKALKTKNCKLETISIGDYVLTGGELPAMVMIDAIARHIPGVLGKHESLEEKRFGVGVPAYTRPEALVYKGKKYTVPRDLLSGNHAKIKSWRKKHQKSA